MHVAGARRRAVLAWLAVALGAWAGVAGAPLAPALILALVLASFAMLAHGRWTAPAALWAALACVAAAWSAARVTPGEGSLIVAFDGLPQGSIVRVAGVVAEAPRAVPRGGPLDRFRPAPPSSAFTLRVDRLLADAGPRAARGVVRVFVAGGSPPSVRPGDRVVVTGVARPVPRRDNPGQIDLRAWAAVRGVAGSLALTDPSLVVPDRSIAGPIDRAASAWLRARGVLRERAQNALDLATAGLEPASKARTLVHTLTLGREPEGAEEAAHELRSAFTSLGVAHALAISGFHLVVLASVLLALVRLTGDRGWAEPAAVAGLILLYLSLVPPSSPIVRSGVLALSILAVEATGRRYDRLTVLVWISAGLLLWRPTDLWSLGYQLSCGLTALLLWLGQATRLRLFPPPIRTAPGPDPAALDPGPGRMLGDACAGLLSSTLLCWLVSAPLILWRTGALALWAVPAGLLVVPLTVVLLALGFAALLAGLVWPEAAGLLGPPVRAVASLTAWTVGALDDAPGGVIRPPPLSPVWIAAATALALYALAGAARRSPLPWALAAALTLWAAAEWAARPGTSRGVAFRLDTLSVGDGTTHLLRSGRHAVLWDCGSSRPQTGRWLLPRALLALGVTRVHTAVLSHPDLDHYSAVVDLAPAVGLRRVLVPPVFLEQARLAPAGPAAAALAALRSMNVDVVEVSEGDRLVMGRTVLRFASPPPDADWHADNEHSLIGIAGDESGRPRAVLAADAGPLALSRLRQAWPGLRVDLAEAPHHGSPDPVALAWLASLDPAVVVQSTGPRRLDDPRTQHIRQGRTWLVTARDGAVWVEVLNPKGVRWGTTTSPSR